MNFWDQRFAEPGYKYGTEPNAFLMEQAARLSAPADVLVRWAPRLSATVLLIGGSGAVIGGNLATIGGGTLNDATDFFAMHGTGFWPVIFVRSPIAASRTLRSATASPTPMLTVIFVIFGTCIVVTPRSRCNCGTIDLR